jgi:hypothetical protein
MNTFLPYPDFQESAKCLDRMRLGKQRVECKQLLLGQFPNHPCSLMWRGYEYALCNYGIAVCNEWIDRGYNDSVKQWIVDFRSTLVDTGPPPWLGRDSVHKSHQSNLLRKDSEHYGKFGWDVPNYLPYDWAANSWKVNP